MLSIKKYTCIGLHEMLVLIVIFTFILSNQIRIGILGETLGAVNYLASIIICTMLMKYINKFKKGYLCYMYIYISYFIINYIYCQHGSKNFIFSFCSFIAPIALIGLEIDKQTFNKFYKIFLKIFNTIILLITIIGLLDLFLGNKLILAISSIMSNSIKNLIYTQQTLTVNRLYSFMGHPLFNTQLYLMFFILNLLYENLSKNRLVNKVALYLIPVIGISMTASKTGLILLLLSFTIFQNSKNKVFHYMAIILFICLMLDLGIFNNTIERLMSETLTTGRSEYWKIYKESGLFPIRMFRGYGNEFVFYCNSIVPWISAGFEYPIRLFSLEQGILFTLILYIGIFIYPVLIFMQRKHIKFLFMYLIIFIDINTYNSIALIGDNLLIFSIFIFIILNVSHVIYKNQYNFEKL